VCFLAGNVVHHDKMFEEMTKVYLATFGCLLLCSHYKDAYQPAYQLESTVFFSHNKTASAGFNTNRTGPKRWN